jgi:hypothetical protein
MEKATRGTLRAHLAEIEPGLFKAVYMEDEDRGVDTAPVPDGHLGTSREGVISWVEQMAAGMGYERVAWE